MSAKLDGRAYDDGEQYEDDADDRSFLNLAGAQELQIQADENSNRNRHADGEGTPRAVVQGVDDDDGHTGHSEDIQEQYGEGRSQADFVADLRFCDFGDGFAVIAHGSEEDNHIVYGPCEDAPDKNPQRAGQITELSGNNRAYERACASDSCEVMAEYDVFVRRNIVVAVFETECRRDFVLVQRQYFSGDEARKAGKPLRTESAKQ